MAVGATKRYLTDRSEVDMSEPFVLEGRSVAEAHLYMDIRGCEPGRRGHRLESLNGDLVSVYECRAGGQTPEKFVFRVLDDPLAVDGLGGDEPSRIIGPGEFLMHAEGLAQRLPASPSGLDARQVRAGRYLIDQAVACMEEVLKFIPASRSAVPEDAFRSTRGLEAFKASPGRFGRPRLEAILGAYRGIAAQYASASS